jgi:hypothetical protein
MKKKSFTKILTNLTKCHLQLDYFEKIIYVNKDWSNDAKVGCKVLNNLVNLIDFELNLKQELNEFESSLFKNYWILNNFVKEISRKKKLNILGNLRKFMVMLEGIDE